MGFLPHELIRHTLGETQSAAPVHEPAQRVAPHLKGAQFLGVGAAQAPLRQIASAVHRLLAASQSSALQTVPVA